MRLPSIFDVGECKRPVVSKGEDDERTCRTGMKETRMDIEGNKMYLTTHGRTSPTY